ncbi:leucine-rich repeat domain-containing protein [Adlercreutzia sp. ZJ304]|uniref:leucine-rich repeat domain-containing protein n=1 Tax=Adlercreutzia sp. ZJ304 TaxID=2709791 RepID=UPI0013E9B289|nr:leucine-rich repeat domain-containing protein [Adlercreutzia sp. ZJ304]
MNRAVMLRRAAKVSLATSLACYLLPLSAYAESSSRSVSDNADAVVSAAVSTSDTHLQSNSIQETVPLKTPATSESAAFVAESVQDIVSASVPVSQDTSAGIIFSKNNLNYQVNSDGETVSLVGFAPQTQGAITLPQTVNNAQNTYTLTHIGQEKPKDGSAKNPYTAEYYDEADKKQGVTSLTIPATVTSIDLAFFQLLPNLTAVQVEAGNATYASYNGMLLDVTRNNLHLVPEGLEGEVVLPAELATVPACVFSRCTKLIAIGIPMGSTSTSTFTSVDGILYTEDLTTLIAAPPTITNAVIVSGCTKISEGAFQGNTVLQTIVANGNVLEIAKAENETTPEGSYAGTAANEAATAAATAATPEAAPIPAFTSQTISFATVATKNTEAWEAAGFTHFASLTEVGNAIAPDESTSGFAYTVLPDYTLSVSWAGENTPAAISLPSIVDIEGVEYDVSTIADEGFANKNSLVAVNIPGSITTIGEGAFAGCENLSSVSLSFGTKTIKANAFMGTAINTLVLPKTIMAIGASALGDIDGATIVALSPIPSIDTHALVATTNTNIYVPYTESKKYGWNLGAPVANNHLLPYGVRLSSAVSNLSVGESVNLYSEDGYLYVPKGATVSYRHGGAISIDPNTSTITCKKPGSSNIEVTILLPLDKSAAAGVMRGDVQLHKP